PPPNRYRSTVPRAQLLRPPAAHHAEQTLRRWPGRSPVALASAASGPPCRTDRSRPGLRSAIIPNRQHRAAAAEPLGAAVRGGTDEWLGTRHAGELARRRERRARAGSSEAGGDDPAEHPGCAPGGAGRDGGSPGGARVAHWDRIAGQRRAVDTGGSGFDAPGKIVYSGGARK